MFMCIFHRMWRCHPCGTVLRFILSTCTRSMASSKQRSTGLVPELQFPYTFKINSKTLVLNECPPNRIDEIVKVFARSASTGEGVGVDEFPTQESLLDKMTSSQMVLIGEEKGTHELAIVYLLYPTPLSRSEKPMYHSGYQIITGNYRKIGLGSVMDRLAGVIAAARFGYQGIIGRTATTSKGLVGMMKQEAVFTGIIPRSILFANKGMMDDLIVYCRYGMIYKQNLCSETPSLPALQVSKMKSYDDITFTPIPMMTSAGTFTLRPGAPDDTEHVEHLIRKAAENGEGFGMDEFKSNGQFNRAFFQRCHLAVLCDSNRFIVGAALFGLSSLVRTTTLETSHIYIVIDREHHRRGIGQKLLENMIKVIRSVGYKRIITDVHCTNHAALHICHKMKFILTASIPDCSYLKQNGFKYSYVLVDHENYSLNDWELLPSKI